MNRYRLVFQADAAGNQKIVKFCASDAGEALCIAHREASHRSAQLWKNDKLVCSIRRADVAGDDLWEIR